jgi:hypothetical protein
VHRSSSREEEVDANEEPEGMLDDLVTTAEMANMGYSAAAVAPILK